MANNSGSIFQNTMRVLAKRDLASALQSWGIYVTVFVSFMVSSWMLKSHLDTLRENNIMITSYPVETPLSWSVIIVSLYLVFVSAVSISREREQGTLETLWYGPVTAPSFLMAKYIKDLLLYLVALGCAAVYFWVASWMTNIGFTLDLVKALGISFFVVSCFVSFGLFISSLAARVRSSVIWMIAVLLGFLAVWFANSVLNVMPEEALSSSLLYIRGTLSVLYTVIDWVSPFSYLSRAMSSITVGNSLVYVLNIVYCLVYSAVLLVLATVILKQRGVRA